MAKCPICGKNKPYKKDLLEHIEDAHQNDIPENMSTAQYVYSLNHNGRSYGICRSCGKPTPWNEKTGKPMQLCGSPQCKQKMNAIAKRNMISKYGKTTLLNDPEQQQLMLANRKISGVYRWSDNKHTFSYTGTYEKFALEWLDKIFDIDPEQIKTPGPTIQYTLNGEKHFWITDMYLSDFNLVIEIKDGNGTGDKNTHPGFSHNRELERAKDIAMQNQTQYNYLKLTNKNMIQLLDILNKIRLNNIFEKDNQKPILSINESIDVLNNRIEFNFDNELQVFAEDSSNILDDHIEKTDNIENIKFTIEKIYKRYDSYDKKNKVKNMTKVLNICKTTLKIISCIIGADNIIDGVNDIRKTNHIMNDIKNETRVNNKTISVIKHKLIIKHILNIIRGIILSVLNCYTFGSYISETFTTSKKNIFTIVNTVDCIIDTSKLVYKDNEIEKICKYIQNDCNKIQSINESINYCNIYETISNDDIIAICESIINHDEPNLVLNESVKESYHEEESETISSQSDDNKDGFNITYKKECFDVGSNKDNYEYLIKHYFGTITNLIHETKGQCIIITNDKLILQIRQTLENAGLSNVEYSKNTHDALTPIHRFKRDKIDVLISDDSVYGMLFDNVNLILVINAKEDAKKYMDLCMSKSRNDDVTLIDIRAVNRISSNNESIMSIANISPIVTPIKFKDIPDHEPTSLEKAIEQAKICLNEVVEDLDDYAAHFCPETLDERTGTFNPVKDAIKNRSCIVETVNKHRGNLYVISDIHIFGRYDEDHEVDAKMVRYIIDNINNKIKPNDTLLILGDIGHRDDKNLKWHTKWFIDSIKCKNIWLVLGNHDLLTIDEYKKIGCKLVCHKLLYNGYEFTHYPIKSKFNFHGHIHNQPITKYDNINYDNHINVFYHARQNLPKFEELLKNEVTMNESNFDMSGVIFGDGEFSSICDSRIDNFITGNSNEDITANNIISIDANMFSPNIEKMPYSYSEPSNNFTNNEEVRVDLQTDPGYSGESDSILTDIAKSIYSSNFIDNN